MLETRIFGNIDGAMENLCILSVRVHPVIGGTKKTDERINLSVDLFRSVASFIYFLCRFMRNQLSTDLYMAIMMINVFIGCLASFSLGVFYEHLEKLDKAMLRLYPLKPNRSMILEHIKSNCSELIVKYPEFNMDSKIDLCRGYQLSLKLVTIAIILSTLYNICLLYGLYDSVLLAAIIMGISSTFLLNTSLSNDGQTLHNLEIILFIIGFGMILRHSVFVNSNNRDRRSG
jgi:hypothetical protein